MKHLATFVLFLGLCLIINAQAPLVKQWDKRFGGNYADVLTAIQQTKDGGYILGGHTLSDSSGDKTQPRWGTIGSDYWIVKIDSRGNKQWDKRFGGTYVDDFTTLQATNDGGYILGGTSFSEIGGDKTQNRHDTSVTTINAGDYWVVKIDGFGNKLWDKRFGGVSMDWLYSVQQTVDEGFILGGYSNSDANGDKSQDAWNGSKDYWVVKIDSFGNKQWDKRFGGIQDDKLYSLQQTLDHGFILGGFSSSDSSGDRSQYSRGYSDYWILKIDSLGNKQWDKRFGGTSYDELYSLQQTSDKGYVLGGRSYSSQVGGDKSQPGWTVGSVADLWIVKTDSSGNKIWDKRFGGTSGDDDFGYIFQTSDDGYLISGNSYSSISGDKTEDNLGQEQAWVVRVDSLGIKQWDKTIFTLGHDETGLAIQTVDGCYAIANYTAAGIGGYKTQSNWSIYDDYWIVKLCDSTHMCNLAAATLTSNQTTFCSGDSAQVCAPSGFTSYLWNTGQTSRCISTQLAGNYYVNVTDNYGCTASSNHLAITVLPLPPVAISVNGDTLSVYSAVTQQWYLNGSAINNATSNVYIATQGGSYTVMVTDTNGCIATSSAVIISGIDNVSEEDVVSVYPNPLTAGGWQLTVGNNFIGGEAEVFDADGRVVFKSEITLPKSKIEFTAARGVYLLRISSSKSSVVRKLIRL